MINLEAFPFYMQGPIFAVIGSIIACLLMYGMFPSREERKKVEWLLKLYLCGFGALLVYIQGDHYCEPLLTVMLVLLITWLCMFLPFWIWRKMETRDEI